MATDLTDRDRLEIGRRRTRMWVWFAIWAAEVVLVLANPFGVRAWVTPWIGPIPFMFAITNYEWTRGYKAARGIR